jgi:RimJ/RimL family protein N-acetyltransferase
MIETDRLRLEPLSRAHLEPWTRFMASAEAKALTHRPEPLDDVDQAARVLDAFAAGAEMYAACVRESRAVAGFTGFVPRTMEWGDELELGWLYLPEHWGRGYATEAALGLRPLKAGRVVSFIRTDNPASENVARKIGATRERVFEWHGYETGCWVSQLDAEPRSIP